MTTVGAGGTSAVTRASYGAMTTGRILITGATSGIGREAVRRFAELGWEVFATGRSEARCAELARSTAKEGNVRVVALDVDQAASIAACKDEILRLSGGYGVDVVVNNAGFARVSPIADLTDEDLRGHFDTNVFAVVSIARAFLPGMMERGKGRIVNVSSSGGRMSLPFVGAYHAAKFAVEALSDAMRWELAPFGVQVSVIEPGPVKTAFADRLIDSIPLVSPTSLYAPALADVEKLQRLAENNMILPAVVVRDIVHAASAKRARPRYVEPRWLALVIMLANLAPVCILDKVISRMFGLAKLKVPVVPVPA